MLSGTEDRSTVLVISCLGGVDDGERVMGRGGGREGAGGGVVPDCDKSKITKISKEIRKM